jgi:hypothetical protein
MKTLSLKNILDQKRLPSHLMIILFSFIIPMILSIGTSRAVFTEFHINLFILLVVQLELFILITGKISHFHICERNVFLNDNQGKDNDVDYSLE